MTVRQPTHAVSLGFDEIHLHSADKLFRHASEVMTQRKSHMSQDSLLRAAGHADNLVMSVKRTQASVATSSILGAMDRTLFWMPCPGLA